MADTKNDKVTLEEDKEAYELASQQNQHNIDNYQADVKFARLEEQWPTEIANERRESGRPMLTINKLGTHIRQVVNDFRQNKPQIKVHPVDSNADIETADVMSDLIRNIEADGADIAYDWGVDCAASGGFGYLRVIDDYAHNDSFDMDLRIARVLDPASVREDPHATSADGSDWNSAFIVDRMKKDDFKARWKGADPVNWDELGYTNSLGDWMKEDEVLVAERWVREEIDKPICLLSNGAVISKEQLETATEGVPYYTYLQLQGIEVKAERTTKSWKVKQRILTGVEILEEKDWKGIWIPIVPIYGEEVFADEKRWFFSLIRSAKDAQRQFNFWETYATETIALAPRVPWTGPEGMFSGSKDAHKWANANRQNFQTLEYKIIEALPGAVPQRQALDTGPAAGAMAEVARSNDNIKATIGQYDASLGAQSNETSGKAIIARDRQGETATFHFSDNMARSMRQVGRILLDLIPHYYSERRIIRVMGEDGTPKQVPLGQPIPTLGPGGQPRPAMGPNGQPLVDQQGRPLQMTHIVDLSKGKYDLTVSTGPSYTTKRQEAAYQMTEMVRAFPAAFPIIGHLIAKNLDWPGADEIAKILEQMRPQPQGGGMPPELQQQMQKMGEALQKLTQENQALKASKAGDFGKLFIDGFRAETERMKTLSDARLNWTELGITTQLDLAGMMQQAERDATAETMPGEGMNGQGPMQ